jgi:ribosomal protein S24E
MDSTRETAFAVFSCGSLNVNVFGMEDNYGERDKKGYKTIYDKMEADFRPGQRGSL